MILSSILSWHWFDGGIDQLFYWDIFFVVQVIFPHSATIPQLQGQQHGL